MQPQRLEDADPPPHPKLPLDVSAADRQAIVAAYRAARAITEALARPLSPEDQAVQSMALASPTKWHLAHVTWFFETFLLAPFAARYRRFHAEFGWLFNSYYEAVGPYFPQSQRGMLSRPRLAEIIDYRSHVDAAMETLIAELDDAAWQQAGPLVVLGLNHEQQHQELLLTDAKHMLSLNPLAPAYRDDLPAGSGEAPALEWLDFEGGVREIGGAGRAFAFDNEGPRHKVYLEPFRLASRPATNREFAEFIADAGYERPELWLSEGWARVQQENWRHPLYWREDDDGGWHEFTLGGVRALDDDAPVAHISYFEADAFAAWRGGRLPTEAEWEIAAAELPTSGNLMASGRLHPAPAGPGGGLRQMFGDVWEWTQSPYTPYPGFRPAPGAVGEYNGKFMCNQMVLRGGSCATPPGHVRASYRNFFMPEARWQFAGLRLAADGRGTKQPVMRGPDPRIHLSR